MLFLTIYEIACIHNMMLITNYMLVRCVLTIIFFQTKQGLNHMIYAYMVLIWLFVLKKLFKN